MNLKFLKGKTAIITGGSGGIGQEIAFQFAECGCKLAILDVDDENGNKLTNQLSDKTEVLYIHCNIASLKEIQNAFKQVTDHFGDIHILINNAGVPVRDYIENITEEKWDLFNAINMKSVFFLSQLFAEQVKERKISDSRIVNLSSIRAHLTDDYHAGYCITKAAVNKITQTFAVSYGKYGLTSNAVALGFVATPMTEHYFKDPKISEILKRQSPLGRAVTTQEVASTILFLVSKRAAAINGQIITIDGGGMSGEGHYS